MPAQGGSRGGRHIRVRSVAGWCGNGGGRVVWRRQRQGGAVAATDLGVAVCVGESEMWGPGGGERAREVVSPLTSVGSPPADGS
jgi:hypothetical protein